MQAMSLHDLVQTMSALHVQLQQASLFLRKICNPGGGEAGSDPALELMHTERAELVKQIQELCGEIKNATARWNAAFVHENVATEGVSSSQAGSGSVSAEAGL